MFHGTTCKIGPVPFLVMKTLSVDSILTRLFYHELLVISGIFHTLKGTAHLHNQPGHRQTHTHTHSELHILFPKKASVYLFAICLNLPGLMLLCCK